MKHRHHRIGLAFVWTALLGLGALNARAQWLTQSFNLVPGWNAVYFHVDSSSASLDELITADAGNPITEVWLWRPAATTGQSALPPAPTGADTQWASWTRALGPSSALQRVSGNSACLVRVGGASPFTWSVKGHPTPPAYVWTTSGLNFIGFPTPPVGPPSFDRFLSQSSDFYSSVEIFRYVGGELGASNPALLLDYLGTPLQRGNAMWIRSAALFNRYFGPFELELQNSQGVHFGDFQGQYRMVLRNLTAASLTVKLQPVSSEPPPPEQTAIVAPPPVLIQGALNPTNLTHAYSALTTEATWTLAPKGEMGSEVEIVLGINRALVVGAPGALYAGILRFTDDQLLSQVDVPVSATVATTAGLWVGGAAVTQVRHYLKTFEKDAEGKTVLASSGAYVPTATNTSLGGVAKPFPLRLIVHNDGSATKLLQRVYLGTRFNNPALVTEESLLDSTNKAVSRRISAAHLPWSASNASWPMTGAFALGGDVTATVGISHEDNASNPFVHTYHPDHDSLDALFSTPLPQGEESYRVTRRITLYLTAPADDFASLTAVNRARTGIYDESITVAGKGAESRQFDVRGMFSLNRVSDISTLTTTP